MKAFSYVAAITAAISGADAYWKGFNVPANNADGSCKSQADWEAAFKRLQSLPGHFSSARLYASSDCNTLANAVPAAIATRQTLLAGVWAENEAHYEAERAALTQALKTHGSDWLIAVTVGNEDLYQNYTTAGPLVEKVNDIRQVMRSMGHKQQVGHVDTWTAWVLPENVDLIKACDFVGTDGYPYFQDASIENGASTYWSSVEAVRNVVNAAKPGAWVWLTEIGWPVSGKSMGPAKASIANAKTYWDQVACKAFSQAHAFWYVLDDHTADPSFGTLNAQGENIYVKAC